MTDDDESRYKVGYKCPPKEYQFKKGDKKPAKSGRAKGHKNSHTIINELFNEQVTVSPDARTLSKREFFIRRNFEKAMKADSVNESVAFVRLVEKLAPKAIDPQPPLIIHTIPGDF